MSLYAMLSAASAQATGRATPQRNKGNLPRFKPKDSELAEATKRHLEHGEKFCSNCQRMHSVQHFQFAKRENGKYYLRSSCWASMKRVLRAAGKLRKYKKTTGCNMHYRQSDHKAMLAAMPDKFTTNDAFKQWGLGTKMAARYHILKMLRAGLVVEHGWKRQPNMQRELLYKKVKSK